MTFARTIQAEILDYLEEDDPQAIRSRADLRRIHFIMGTRGILLSALLRIKLRPRRIVELGAGDATLTLRVAQVLAREWGPVHLTLLDRRNVVSAATVQAFNRLGWQVEILNTDLLDWIRRPLEQPYDLALTTLFLHHFKEAELSAILHALSRHAHALCACEPRRARLPLCGSHLVGLLGANAVTREDAVLSVKAGFADQELSRLMAPAFHGWQIEEYAAGLFSHCLFAKRQPDRHLESAQRTSNANQI
jgi:hypothetical protein